jgi:release factor glutamine methyltransferase
MMALANRPSVLEVVRLSTGYLEEKGIESPRQTAEILLSHILGCRRIDLYLWFDRPMEEAELATMRRYLRRRAAGTPVDYIVKQAEFYGLHLQVDPRVMVPRPETEVLVEKVLALVAGPFAGPEPANPFLFLDIGTGSGAISLAILDQVPGSVAVATDVSIDALHVALANAESLDLSHRFNPVLGRLFHPLRACGEFDLIVSNPPYVSELDRESLPREVREHEPAVALFAGEDGLGVIRGLVNGAPGYLKAGGIIALEIGDRQAEAVERLVAMAPGLEMVAIEKDLSGIERIVIGRKEGGTWRSS